jgi:hypothetical protein
MMCRQAPVDKDSCHGCKVMDRTLACACFNGVGDEFRTEIALAACNSPGSSIGNSEGKLSCSIPSEPETGEPGFFTQGSITDRDEL